MKLQKLLPLALLSATYFTSHAQQTNKAVFSFTADSLQVTELLQQVEAQSNVHFYYDTARLNGIRVTLQARDITLDSLLTLAFKNTDLRFARDKYNHVFITPKIQVQTMLAAGFYEKADQTKNDNAENLAGLELDKKREITATAENSLYTIGTKNTTKDGNAIINGYLKNAVTGEPVVNASVYVDALKRGTVTDQYGYYSINLPEGRHAVNVQSVGMKDIRLQVQLNGDGSLNIEMHEQVTTLKNVIVSSQKVNNIRNVQMGVERLAIATIKNVPTVFGEADILRVVLTLPGVKTVGEISTGFNVRGGSTDQNLILLNDATIYNPSHFFGMFSAFNPEIVKDIELYKSTIPAKFGGRLSSVLDISTREGNKKNITGSAGVGPVTSRFNIEGPIGKKEATSFIFGARATYANWLLKLLPGDYKNSKAGFNDFNAGLSHHINAKNDLYVSAYFSSDRFSLISDTDYSYSNRNASVKWKHSFNNRLTGFFTTGADQYQYSVKSDGNKINAYKLAFDINQLMFKTDFTYLAGAKHTFDFGLSSIYYKLHPGSLQSIGPESQVVADVIPQEQALESAAYFSDKYNISSKLSVSAGLRFSMFNYLAPQDINIYSAGTPKEENTIIETRTYGSGVIKTYKGPEYRLSMRYAVNNTFSIKAGYNSSYQYIHLLTNTTAMAPTDIWKLSDPNIEPQQGNQVSLGLYKNLKSNTIETSAEVYYKKLKNYLDYKSGAKLVLNHHIETDVVNTRGKAYGIELLFKKTSGKLNGWISYTYSRILLKMDDSTVSQPVNHGEFYPANYDKPHDVTMVGNFKVNHRFSLSLNVTYSTGRPISVPIGRYYYAGSERVLYSDRNSYRIPDYFRSDFSMNIDGNHKVNQKTHNSWTVGCYNITGRKNPYSIYFVSENGRVNGYKLSIFGSIIPFVNYNIRF